MASSQSEAPCIGLHALSIILHVCVGRPSGGNSGGSIHEGEHLLSHHQLRFGRSALTQRELRQAQANDALRFEGEKSCIGSETHPGFQHPLFSGLVALIANHGADQVNAPRRSGHLNATAVHRNARLSIGRPEQAGGARRYFARDVDFTVRGTWTLRRQTSTAWQSEGQ